MGIGPKFAYFIGGPESKSIPYFGMGFSFLNMSESYYRYSTSASGFRIKMGFGICQLIGRNGCIPIEAGCLIDNLNYEGESASSVTLYIVAGIGCFTF